MTEPLVVSELAAHVATIRLNRPKAFNALDLETTKTLTGALMNAATDPVVRAVVLTGSGRAFCAGGDLVFLKRAESREAAFHELAAHLHLAATEIRRMHKPVIAAINGVAAGAGFSLALGCDLRVMDPAAKLVQAYSSAGLSLDGGGSYALPRLVGMAKALEIVAFDEPIDAQTALGLGLTTKVSEAGGALTMAQEMAGKLALRSAHGFGRSKALLSESFDTPFEKQVERERAAIAACGSHRDGIEGLDAFVEKRKPRFV